MITREQTRFVIAEAIAYFQSRRALGKAVDIVEQLASFYSLIVECVRRDRDRSQLSDEENALISQILSCRYNLLAGIGVLLRGHTHDSKYYLRRAIENTLFCVYFFEFTGAAGRWLNAAEGQHAWKAYREAFNIMDMLSLSTYETIEDDQERDLLANLTSRYEDCCVSTHATSASLGQQLRTEQRDGVRRAIFHTIDQSRGSRIKGEFLVAVSTHYIILLELVNLLYKAEADYSSPLLGDHMKNDARAIEAFKTSCRPELDALSKQLAARAGIDDLSQYKKFWDEPRPERKKRKLKIQVEQKDPPSS